MACPRYGVPTPQESGEALLADLRARPQWGRRIERDVCYCSMREWFDNGPFLIATVPGLKYVSITDRSPLVVEIEPGTGLDRGHVEAHGRRHQYWDEGYGWMYGYRWLWDPAEDECAAYHLPEELFRRLPDCPFPAVVADRWCGRGTMPRWDNPGAAMTVLNATAWGWAAAGGPRFP